MVHCGLSHVLDQGRMSKKCITIYHEHWGGDSYSSILEPYCKSYKSPGHLTPTRPPLNRGGAGWLHRPSAQQGVGGLAASPQGAHKAPEATVDFQGSNRPRQTHPRSSAPSLLRLPRCADFQGSNRPRQTQRAAACCVTCDGFKGGGLSQRHAT